MQNYKILIFAFSFLRCTAGLNVAPELIFYEDKNIGYIWHAVFKNYFKCNNFLYYINYFIFLSISYFITGLLRQNFCLFLKMFLATFISTRKKLLKGMSEGI